MLIFDRDNYKQILKDFIQNQPRKGHGLVKAIGEYIGVDPSLVSQVLSGSKDFTEEQALQITSFVGFNEIESEYFLTLVKIERAGTKLLKDHYKKRKDQLKIASLDLKKRLNQDRILTDYEKSVFYSSYIYSAIRLSTSISNGKTISELSKRFDLSIEKTTEVINFLLNTNLITEKNGKYILGTQHTHLDRGSPFLNRHHHNWRVKALDKTNSITDQELQFTGPVSISNADFQVVRELLVEVISKSMSKVKASSPDDVACLLIDWFWLK
ncbi:MAG: TIGR02147 family protein [Pseudobdellovibrio sp.]